MRILYIVTAFPRWPGDVITPWMLETIERLRDLSIDVEVLAPAYRGLGKQVFRGIPVHRFRYAPAWLETLTHDQTTPDRIREKPAYLGLVPGYIAAGTIAAARIARLGRFDVVHSFWPLPHGLLGLAAARIAGIPHVSTFFGVELTWLRRQLPFLSPIARSIVRRSDAVTVISSHTERELYRLVPDARVRTIPFGAAIGSRNPDSAVSAESVIPHRVPELVPDGREPGASLERAEFRLLFVGRLVERKGVSVLLRALALLRMERMKLTIVGDGPLRGELEQQVETLGIGSSVTFTGFVPDAEVARHYGDCDAFILPAVRDSKGDEEGLGVVLIEALLRSRPVIASASGGIPDIVKDGETGLLVPPGDVEALAEAIRRVMDRATGDRLGRAGRADVERRFSWDVIVASLAGLYRDVVASRALTDANLAAVRSEDGGG